jgi:hypothetical protein
VMPHEVGAGCRGPAVWLGGAAVLLHAPREAVGARDAHVQRASREAQHIDVVRRRRGDAVARPGGQG